jgi:hypothetical protein
MTALQEGVPASTGDFKYHVCWLVLHEGYVGHSWLAAAVQILGPPAPL